MGKRLKIQKRGKGTPKYRATKKGSYELSYISYDDTQKNDVMRAFIAEIIKDTGKSAVLAEAVFEDNQKKVIIAAEGISKGQTIQLGRKAEIAIGNIMPLKYLPEGCPVFNIELQPGDGGKLTRTAGSYAIILTKDKESAFIKLPSGKTQAINLGSRATIGCAAGGGRGEKPFVKAGARYHLMRSLNKSYPGTRGVAMNPVSHPFGGGQHHPGHSKSTSRHAPPGRKVGAIASRRTGRVKKN